MRRSFTCATIAVACQAGAALGEITSYTDHAQWLAAAGGETAINFTDLPAGTLLSDQYRNVSFITGEYTVVDGDDFLTDGRGFTTRDLHGAHLYMQFPGDMHALAFDFPGGIHINLFAWGGDGNLHFIGAGEEMGIGPGSFGGIVSTTAFNYVEIWDFQSNAFRVDNMYLPSPSASSVLILAASGAGLRRRRPS